MATNTPLTTTDITPRAPDGKWLQKPAKSKDFTSESGRTANQKRWEKYRQAAVDRVIAEGRGIDPTIKGGADAWGLLVSKQYIALMDSEKPRGDDLHRIGQVLGAVPMAHEVQREDTGAAVSVSLSAAGLARLVALLAGGAADVVEGEVSEAGGGGGGGG